MDPEIVLRELAYQPGEIFSPAKIAESQAKILALDLFGLVRIAPKEIPGKPSIVPMEVQVSEKEAREIRVGVGYGTEDQFRAQLRWQHNNWLGGGKTFLDSRSQIFLHLYHGGDYALSSHTSFPRVPER